jgi:hypothetical protein
LNDTPKPGQWVRFYREGKMVIGVVQYVTPASSWDRDKWVVNTDVGSTGEGAILEAR